MDVANVCDVWWMVRGEDAMGHDAVRYGDNTRITSSHGTSSNDTSSHVTSHVTSHTSHTSHVTSRITHATLDEDTYDLEQTCIRYIQHHFIPIASHVQHDMLCLTHAYTQLHVDMLHALLASGGIDAPDHAVLHLVQMYIQHHADVYITQQQRRVYGPCMPPNMRTQHEQHMYDTVSYTHLTLPTT